MSAALKKSLIAQSSAIRALVFSDGSGWFAQCLEVDVGATGASGEEVVGRVAGEVSSAISLHGANATLNDFISRPAAPDNWREFALRASECDVVFLAFGEQLPPVPPGFPYCGLLIVAPAEFVAAHVLQPKARLPVRSAAQKALSAVEEAWEAERAEVMLRVDEIVRFGPGEGGR